MGRVGEGFNLARVNQASLIDEPALRAGRGMSVHGPWPPQAMGNGQWEAEMGGTGELGSYGYLGTYAQAYLYRPAVAGSRAVSSAAMYTTGSGFPAEISTKYQVPSARLTLQTK